MNHKCTEDPPAGFICQSEKVFNGWFIPVRCRSAGSGYQIDDSRKLEVDSGLHSSANKSYIERTRRINAWELSMSRETMAIDYTERQADQHGSAHMGSL